MHTTQNIVALKAPNESLGKGHILQIYNMDQKKKLKHIELSENIVYWRWVSTSKLAIVTGTSVYHINIDDEASKEVKILDRSGGLVENPTTQIIGYCLEPAEKWSALFGISTPDQGKTINGHIQLYLIEGGKQQLLEGHACTFGKAYIHNDSFQSTLFCFVEKKQGEAISKVHINEISAAPEGFTKHKKNTEIQYDPSFPSDFPISLNVSEKYGLLYIVTKFGFLYVYEMISCEQIFKARLSQEPIFVVAKNSVNDGILAITKSGSLIGGVVDESMLLPTIMNAKHIPNVKQLAFQIAGRYKLPGVDNMFIEQFNTLLISGDYAGAAQVASQSPGALIRNQETIQKFKSLPQMPNQPQPLLIYFQKLLEKGKLNKLETLELCVPVLSQGKIDLVSNWVNNNKLENCQELGEMVVKFDKHLALKIYTEGKFNQKAVQLMM
jgi:clathrin heavy chain